MHVSRETFVFKVFRRVFHSSLKLELCRHACRRRETIISTCRYGKNMPTTALVDTQQNSYSISHYATLWLHGDWTVTVWSLLFCQQLHVTTLHVVTTVNDRQLTMVTTCTVTVQLPCSHSATYSGWWNRSFDVYMYDMIGRIMYQLPVVEQWI